jgi:large subunit ribosomal protein L17
MRKRKTGRKFNRETDQRKALLVLLASSLILKEKIRTTQAKAKEISGYTEKQITKARTGSLHARRLAAKLFTPKVVKKLFDEVAPKYKDRKGGYTRIIKLPPKKINGAKMAIIELVK